MIARSLCGMLRAVALSRWPHCASRIGVSRRVSHCVEFPTVFVLLSCRRPGQRCGQWLRHAFCSAPWYCHVLRIGQRSGFQWSMPPDELDRRASCVAQCSVITHNPLVEPPNRNAWNAMRLWSYRAFWVRERIWKNRILGLRILGGHFDDK